MKKRLTDTMIDGLRPQAKRYIVMDSVAAGLGVRVSTSGRKTFVMVARFSSKHPTARSFGKITLEEARDKAHTWRKQLARGVDPKRPNASSFGAMAEKFFDHIKHQRRAHDCERIVRRELRGWWEKPLSSITRREVIDTIDRVKANGTPSAAHQLLAHMRRVFNYTIARDVLEYSPCDRLRASALIGERIVRKRVLTDDEIRALWRASERVGYPYGPLWQLLLVTGQRRSDVANARWTEFDIGNSIWTIPPERFKSDSTHIVPLTQLAIDVLDKLPRDGELVFGHINGFSKAKRRLDKAIGDPAPFVIHDLRRTVRTRLSSLRVPYEVAEMVIGHGKKGLARVYDQHHYLPEMRDALERWETSLRSMLRLTCTDKSA